MSSEKYILEIQANIERAHQAIKAAQELLETGHSDFAASRAYYAAFYAATALLLKEEMKFSKHSGVIASIHQNFIKTGRLEKQYGRDLNWLFELRNVGDYGETVHVPYAEADKAVSTAANFVEAMASMIYDT